MKSDHLAMAKRYIAIAESGDSKVTAYKKAADEIIKARDDDPKLSYAAIDRQLGRGATYWRDLVQWRSTKSDHLPFGGPKQDIAQSKSRAKKALSDPALRREVIAALPAADRAAVAQEAVSDPKTAETVMSDRKTAAAVTRAHAAAQDKARDRVEADHPNARKQREHGDIDDAVMHLINARGMIGRDLKRLAGYDLDKRDKAELIEWAEELQGTLDWYLDYLKTDNLSFEEELEAMLKESN